MDLRRFCAIYAAIAMFIIPLNALADEAYDRFCAGPNAFLNIVDRPSILQSGCVTPDKSSIMELGYTYQSLVDSGFQSNFPQALYRYGLPGLFEIDVVIPNYYYQNINPRAGFGATALGVKYVLGAKNKWMATLEGLIAPASGSASFGTAEPSGSLNAIITHNINNEFSTTTMFSISSQSSPSLTGGQSYFSFNPDFLLSWNKNNLSLYAELFAQTKTAPKERGGLNMDLGLIYLFRKNLTVDFSVGQRLTGTLGGYNQYISTGFAVFF
jgi:hypothetical protein